MEVRLFSRTLQHPILAPMIEFVPTDWLLPLANPCPARTTTLGHGVDASVNWDELFAHLLEFGMRDPFIVGVGRVTRRVRLETGNQRVRCMHLNRIVMVPTVAYVSDGAVTSACNGHHAGADLPLRLPVPEISMDPYPVKVFARLSDVLSDMPAGAR